MSLAPMRILPLKGFLAGVQLQEDERVAVDVGLFREVVLIEH